MGDEPNGRNGPGYSTLTNQQRGPQEVVSAGQAAPAHIAGPEGTRCQDCYLLGEPCACNLVYTAGQTVVTSLLTDDFPVT